MATTNNGGALLPAGYLSTSGNQIVDSAGNPVRIASVGWNQGFDNPAATLAAMKAAGFNTVRVSWVDATMNSDLQRIDQIVSAASAAGMKVILDHHTNEEGTAADGYGAQQQNGLPYDVGGASNGTNGAGVAGTVSLAKYQQDWTTVAQHYAGNSTVIGFDLDNEPLEIPGGSTWGSGDPNTDLQMIYSKVGNAIQAVNPGALIIAEGPQNYSGSAAGTGPAPWGDLSLAGQDPVKLNIANKVVYSVHDYPATISGWNQDSGSAAVAAMNKAFGYLETQNIAPVWIGEMGGSLDGQTDSAGSGLADEQAWAQTLVDYMNGKDGAQGGPTFTGNQQGMGGDWWAWGDLQGQWPDGTLNADGSLKAGQQQYWSQILFKPAKGSPTPTPTPAPTPTPTPAPTASADGTVIKAGSTAAIVDAQGNKWTIAGGVVQENGSAAGYSSGVSEIAYAGGSVWQENGSNLWWKWSGSDWGTGDGTATSPLASGPTPTPSPTPAPTPAPTPTPTPTGTAGNWLVQSINGMKYMVLLPAGYDPSVKYPTTLYLHQLDNGSYGPQALQQQIDAWFNTPAFRSAHPSIIVAPLLDQTADLSGQTINFGGISTADTAGETNAIAALKQVMAKYSVDTSRVYVTGNSMGGIGTDDMLVKYNAYTGTEGHIFAAGLSLAGADYGQGYPTPNASVIAALKNVPYWAIHGGQDTQVPLAFDQNLFAAEQAIGGVMKYTQDNSLGHDVWDTYYTQTGPNSPLSWLYNQKASGSPTPTPTPTPAPTPTPTPAPTVSADNTVVTAAGKAIVDAQGNAWTITAGGQVAVNGVADATTANVVELAYEKGTIWQENTANLWWSKAAPTDQWGPTFGTSTSPVPAAPTPTPTPTPAPTPTPTPSPTPAPASVNLTTQQGYQVSISGDTSGTIKAGDDTFSLSGNASAAAALGSSAETLRFVSMDSVMVLGGAGASTVSIDSGVSTIIDGTGGLTVSGGPGVTSYQVAAGAGALTINDFSAAKGDSLTIAKSLQAGMTTKSDGHGGTDLVFAVGAAGTVDLKGIAAIPTASIHWS